MLGLDVILQAGLSGLFMGSVYALIAIGFTLVFGVTNIVNFAHGHFVMGAMFVTYLLFKALKVDPYVGLVVVLPLFFVLGSLIYRLVIQRIVEAPHSAHMMVTLGLLIFIENLANLFFGGDLRGITTTYTTSSLVLGDVSFPVARMGAAAVSLAAVVGLALVLHRTSLGKAIRAAANNPEGAALVGIDVGRVYRVAFSLGTAAAALAGAVIMPFSLVSPFVGGEFILKAFVIAVLGGLGSVAGALIGGLLIGLVEALSSLYISASLGNAIVFAILIAVLLYRPWGILGQARV
ncbi:MAG TPA: branched-chain amino acid ABC transporter permease [Candidatus Dormibacteraeota bacterium]|jgi:branched-chain amino acid transport system permease protein|nr:branched-chain amino acid ABC transporter permease [Candidatus Dormibacteraeota bacterium]